jgi:uncharacterized HAD superfamily protein
MRIAIDIDSTLHHYWDQFSDVVRRRFGIDLPYEDQHTWSVGPLGREEVADAVRRTHTEPLIAAAEPYAGAVEVVNGWHEAGHFIHITSHRPDDAHGPTTTWLEAIGLRYDELYCSYDKITRCREIGIDLLVDDSPVNLEAALEAGIACATILHPWNRDLVARTAVVGAEDWPALGRALEPLLRAGPAAPDADTAR